MLVVRQKMIYRTDIRANPHVLYIFGDNLERRGFGGQAREMRHEPNSFGIATKRKPEHGTPDCYFHDEDEDVLSIIDSEFRNLANRVQDYNIYESSILKHHYKAIVIPSDGIGTGLSRMPEFAPKTLKYIEEKLERLKYL